MTHYSYPEEETPLKSPALVENSKSNEQPSNGEDLDQILGAANSNFSMKATKVKICSDSSERFPRLVKKDGNFNWTGKTVGHHHFFGDIFTTLVEIQWRLLLLVFCVVYFGSWLIFALIWWGLLYLHGDFEEGNYGNSSLTPCIADLKDFTGAFLFSVETQHTTGYGFYHLTEECSSTIITFCLQSIVGCITEGVLVGLIFVKIARGKKRTATLLFSKHAVLHRGQNGLLSFMFRLADLRDKSNLLEARIRAQVVTWNKPAGQQDPSLRKDDLEIGEYVINKEKLDVSAGGEDGTDFLLFWPTTVVHLITESSPLHKFFNAQEHKISDAVEFGEGDEHFEVIVVLEGIVEATGQMTQARSSYLPSEIFLDHTFRPLKMKTHKSRNSAYEIDYSNFNEIIPVTNN